MYRYASFCIKGDVGSYIFVRLTMELLALFKVAPVFLKKTDVPAINNKVDQPGTWIQ